MSEERADAQERVPGEPEEGPRDEAAPEDEEAFAGENGYAVEGEGEPGYEGEPDEDEPGYDGEDEDEPDYEAEDEDEPGYEDEDEYDADGEYDYEYEYDPDDEGQTVEQAALPDGFRPCASCGDPVEPRQLVCLSCGARVALTHGRSFLAEPVVPLIVAVVVIGAALFGFAIAEITSDSGGGGQSAAQDGAPAPAVVDGERQRPRAEGGPAQTTTTTETTPAAAAGPLEWPPDLTAHTVVLVTTGDRAAAVSAAKEARSTGLEAGVLPSDPYDLGTNLWIVFSGRFTTPEGASSQASQLAERYPGAYPQLIQRSQ